MTQMRCPQNGLRDLAEFVYGGEVYVPLDPAASDASWTAYLFAKRNCMGHVHEWWCHQPSNYWFIAERDTTTGAVLRTLTVVEFEAIGGVATASSQS